MKRVDEYSKENARVREEGIELVLKSCCGNECERQNGRGWTRGVAYGYQRCQQEEEPLHARRAAK